MIEVPPHALRKHSVRIAGHRTSFSLEAAFWEQFRRIATARGLSLGKLVAEIDRGRAADAPGIGL